MVSSATVCWIGSVGFGVGGILFATVGLQKASKNAHRLHHDADSGTRATLSTPEVPYSNWSWRHRLVPGPLQCAGKMWCDDYVNNFDMISPVNSVGSDSGAAVGSVLCPWCDLDSLQSAIAGTKLKIEVLIWFVTMFSFWIMLSSI